MKYEIYYNGEKVSLKWVCENYGEMYVKELKEEIKTSKPFDTLSDDSGMLEVFTW